MKIRITNASKSLYWYANRVGEVFDAEEELYFNGGSYRVQDCRDDTEHAGYVDVEDCVVITEDTAQIDGRKAEITLPGKWFDTYVDFAVKHGYPDAAYDYRKGGGDTRKPPQKGDTVTLLVSGEHDSMYEGDTLWIVEATNDKGEAERHIFNEKGLRILDDGITVLPDESLGGARSGVLREYREVKRKARVGERIKIVAAKHTFDMYDNGDVLGVSRESWGNNVEVDAVSSDNGNEDGFIGYDEYVVLEPTEIVRIGSERLRMVDRKATVGERVIITESTYGSGIIAKCTLAGEYKDGSINVRFPKESGELRNGFLDCDYEKYRVLEPVTSEAESAPTQTLSSRPVPDQIAENIAALQAQNSALEAKVTELETRLNALYDWHKRAAIDLRVAREDIVLIEEGVSDDIKSLESRVSALESSEKSADSDDVIRYVSAQTPQQIRDEIVERAKADVKALLDRNYPRSAGYYPSIWFTNKDGAFITDRCDFFVNRDKRTVVALIKSVGRGRIKRKGIAKCAPNDVFNAHIGKAIALRRALGLEIPAEYLSVPAPEEVRVGDIVQFRECFGDTLEMTVDAVESDRLRGKIDGISGYVRRNAAAYHGGECTDPAIIDDSREGADVSASSAQKGAAA